MLDKPPFVLKVKYLVCMDRLIRNVLQVSNSRGNRYGYLFTFILLPLFNKPLVLGVKYEGGVCLFNLVYMTKFYRYV